jgi:hypothetical protein
MSLAGGQHADQGSLQGINTCSIINIVYVLQVEGGEVIRIKLISTEFD